jgi:hypothetical protein
MQNSLVLTGQNIELWNRAHWCELGLNEFTQNTGRQQGNPQGAQALICVLIEL